MNWKGGVQHVFGLRAFLSPLHRGLLFSMAWQVALLVLSLGAMPFDHRTVQGLNPWFKPVKFELSVLIFLGTMALLLLQLTRAYAGTRSQRNRSREAGRVGWVFAIAMIVENTLIALQAARGLRSHMNFSSPSNALIFAVMGLFIALNTGAVLWLLVLYLDRRTHLGWPSAVNAGARLGLAVLFLGSLEGFVMVLHGNHLVGAPDSGEGIAFINWSMVHGDLRIPHFFALHALQIFLLVGLALSRTHWRRLVQVCTLTVFAALYLGTCCWLFRLAVTGRPVHL